MALPKEMREIRRIVMALSLGIFVTLLFSHWGRFAEALNLGILVAMVYDLIMIARAAVLLDGRQSRGIFASAQPRFLVAANRNLYLCECLRSQPLCL